MKYFIFSLMFLLTSCTYSINVVHTEGTASDVVDDTATVTATPSTTITIPPIGL